MDAFSIAFVCSGNRFRSPLAEAFVRRLTLGFPVEVESFGTLDLGSVPALAEAHQIAQWCGVDVSGHRTRHLSFGSLEHTDLVLGFEEGHVRRAVVDADAARGQAFTLREIVSLLEEQADLRYDHTAASARTAIRSAGERRAARPGALAFDPIRDPFGSPWRVYTSTAVKIRELSIALARALFGVTDTASLPDLSKKIPQPRRIGRRR